MGVVSTLVLGVSGPLLVLLTSVTSLVWFQMCHAEWHRSLGGVRDCLVSEHTLALDLGHVSQSPIQHLCTYWVAQVSGTICVGFIAILLK